MENLLERAAILLKVKKDELKDFDVFDPFNNLQLFGFICRKSDYRYGTLVIFKINNEMTEQIIYGTPKLDYPFDRNGVYNWPKVKELFVYDKLDGTNILSYWYKYNGKSYCTFKTRLTPIVQDNQFQQFRSMWIEYMEKNDWVMNLITTNMNYNLSFELFGSRNLILIKYDFPLEVNFLFAVDQKDASIIPPTVFLKSLSNVKIPNRYRITQKDLSALTDVYNKCREYMTTVNNLDENDEYSVEGMVFYTLTEGDKSWRLFKCKPSEIENIHWTASGSLPKNSILTTAMNVFENNDDPIIDDLIELLKEEFPIDIINKSMIKIKKCWEETIAKMELIKKVNSIWNLAKEKGLDITKDKSETMRFISNYFPKNYMSRVGTIILKQAGLLKEKEGNK